jgi:RNA 2',3'-cyclic 3'-phosphodiesterase
MRLFTALDLPGDVVRNLEELVARLKPAAPIHWSPPANLHVTTKFIGEWPDARLPELRAALAALPERPQFEVSVSKLGFYPNERGPRVFWCGIEAAGLAALAAETGAATGSLGVAGENRAYSPHLTLARIKDRCDLRPLHSAIAAIPSLDFGRFTARSFFLFRSQLRDQFRNSGSVYTKLAEFPFSKR